MIAPYIALITNTESEILSKLFLFLNLPAERKLLIKIAVERENMEVIIKIVGSGAGKIVVAERIKKDQNNFNQ